MNWGIRGTGNWIAAALGCFFVGPALRSGLEAAQISSSLPEPDSTSGVREIIVVFKTHFDIGYTDMATNVVRRYRTEMMDNALKCVEISRSLPPEQQFVWTVPGWPMSKILEDWPGQSSERKATVLRAFKEGRFAVHALPFSTHTELLEPEDLVRGLGFSSRLSREVGLSLPRDAKMTDVPCHTWFVPTLLKNAGVDFLHLGCNSASRSPEVPVLFWWEGPDGSRLLTMYSAEGYGTGLEPPRNWPCKTWLALIQTGDNHGPPQPDEIARLLDEAKQKLPGVKIRIGRLSDFADAILAEKPKLPVVRADMPDTWIHGPMCNPAGARLARNTRPLIGTAETLDTLLRTWGVGIEGGKQAVSDAYEDSLLYGEHTWGGSLGWVVTYSQQTKFEHWNAWREQRAQGRFRRLEASWAEHSQYIEKAAATITPFLESELKMLADHVKSDAERIVVYNPLPWKRDGVVSVRMDARSVAEVRPLDGKRPMAAYGNGGLLSFVASDVPPMGYRTFIPLRNLPQPRTTSLHHDATTLENEFLRVTLNPETGVIRSLIDKRSGRQLVNTSLQNGFGQYLYERFDADQVADYVKAYVKSKDDWAVTELGKPGLSPAKDVPYAAASPRDCRLSFEQTAISVSALAQAAPSAQLPHATATKFSLYAGQPYLELEITLFNKPADSWPEAGWICFPVNASNPQFRLERQASIIDPTKEVIRGANRHFFGINGGLTILDSDGRGLGICPLDNPLVSLDTPGCWKYSLDFLPRRPIAFINLFNNQWSTNFRLWNEGTWTSRIRVWAIDGATSEAGLVTPSLESRYPLQAAFASNHSGTLPPSQSGLSLSRKGILVTALCANPDGPGTLLRLWEYEGRAGVCQVRLPMDLKASRAQPVDLRGRPVGKTLQVSHHGFETELRAFAPASFIFETPNK